MSKKVYIDPVCKMKVKIPDKEEKDILSFIYNGITYYFCSSFCTAEFIKNPSKYIAEKNEEKIKNNNESYF